MKAIILGSGRIGRGFIAELMTLNNVSLSFFDINPEFVNLMNQHKEYTIHILGDESLNVKIEDVQAHVFDDVEVFAREWANADFIFTACGGKNLTSIGEKIGQAFRLLAKNGNLRTSNLVTCENWINPVEDLRTGIESQLSMEEKQLFDQYIGVSESVIMCTGTGAPDPSKVTNPVDTWLQNLRYLPVNRDLIRGDLPEWQYIDFVEEFGDLLTQKIYTNNTSVATLSYLGYLKGIVHVADAANDEEIEPILDEVYREINEILVNGLGINKDSQLKFSKTAKVKYTDRAIVDLVTRIARDPIRKLGPEDRFIGPMTIAIKANVEPKAIALGAAAALYFDDKDDEVAQTLMSYRREHGVDAVLRDICKVDPNGNVATWIKDAIVVLKSKGWVSENE